MIYYTTLLHVRTGDLPNHSTKGNANALNGHFKNQFFMLQKKTCQQNQLLMYT